MTVDCEFGALRDEATLALESLHPTDEMCGWMTLPSADISAILKEAARLRAIADTVVCVGIGGSYLGARAVSEALGGSGILFAGHTLSESYMQSLLDDLRDRSFAVIVISKSGTTLEPALAFRFLRTELERRYGAGAAERIVAVTDAEKGALREMAGREGWRTFVVPDNVGGRFSVLSPVGLLPLAVAGVNVAALLEGARSVSPSLAVEYAAARQFLYRQGLKIELLAVYEPALTQLTEWWKQLFGESEGKNGRGLFPASVQLTTDLHSLGQYIQQGERILFETVLTIEQTGTLPIPLSDDSDGFAALAGRPLGEVNRVAEQAVSAAHAQGGVPVLKLGLPRLDAFSLGSLLYFFELACAISARMMGLDPFDQPGVEVYKKNLKELLR